MSTIPFWAYMVVMAGVTYLTRMTPFVLFRKRVRSRFLRSFLAYAPYAVLGAMTFPSILYSTASVPSAICGLVAAAAVALKRRSLILVALAACAAAWLSQFAMTAAGIL